MDDVDDDHDVGGLVNEVVEDMPHGESGVKVFSLELPDLRKGVRVGLQGDCAFVDFGEPVCGPAETGFLSM